MTPFNRVGAASQRMAMAATWRCSSNVLASRLKKAIRLAEDRWIVDSLPLEYQYRAALPAALTDTWSARRRT